HNWKIAIWDLVTGRLLHVLEVPSGYSTDNAALTFSPSGDRFAFSTKRTAKMWDVKTGRDIDSWNLPPGMADKIAFDPTGKKLLLVRLETTGEEPPLDGIPFDRFPRVVRAYDLLSLKQTKKPFAEITAFKRHAYLKVVAPDASYFVVEGFPDADKPRDRIIT